MTTDTAILAPTALPDPADRPDIGTVPAPEPQAAVPHRLKPARNGVFASVALLVFPPTGIAALVNAFGVDEAWYEGDADLAARRSRRALAWSWASVAAGVAFALMATFAVASAVSAAMTTVQPAMDTLSSVNDLLVPGGSDTGEPGTGTEAPDIVGGIETLQELGGMLSGEGGEVSAEDVGKLIDDIGGLVGGLTGEQAPQG